ncbi:indolepyruvate ferredoxin oxidoreductase family protein [Roseospira marina]|uniref:Indolepyruvate ferredoxin oxidoreductase family protein n=1 Tax=Roseospira marina TaxID=140057 RepID=A0A5M6IBK2_9PROT|nr:indolepyruvate ferredoxin oxidoreductase family protein [Roseospira marina]KAA5605623.1 indolepyruvate ferredoxin oxidoreductase family protein [Roseospira marina]MBB4313306.1 indolepyruvate ferredoxin oxidoreductase [Roseospira marina]MBB5085953.1 indolepyruvate ferredoxin oxidoreductase [Roseospira marina]
MTALSPLPMDQVTLDDKYSQPNGRVFLTGIQALTRLLLAQRQRDKAAGLNTGGFVSGYRGSPLGAYDKELWKAKPYLEAENIHFQPGVNEDLAATAVWGTQQVHLFPGAQVDGVFGVWYGKGPGVDRSGDVFKHGNMAGTAPHGGVLLIAGDDHAAKSSTIAHQSEHALSGAQIPVLNPAGVDEVVEYGLLGIAMSRYAGVWVAMKAISETCDSGGAVDIDPLALEIVTPTDFEVPPDGVHIRWPDTPLAQEYRLMRTKIYAALAFARANRIDRVIFDSPEPRLGIVASGKAYKDVRQALADLGITERVARDMGIRLYKVGMPWPLERDGIRRFAEGLEEILVVEEKRALIENQLKEQLYNWREDVRPRIVGKFDEAGSWILPSAGELTPAMVARAIAGQLRRFVTLDTMEQRLAWLERKEAELSEKTAPTKRLPYYCSGCPHNTSTKVPEGSAGLAGIGCHYMVTWMPERNTKTFTHMGGEGANWVGLAPFTETRHMFVNLGDGTYFHSGSLAIRQAVAAGANVTYKLLYNDAVAMTGGQPVDGTLTVPQIAHQLEGEGAKRIALVSDDPEKYTGADLPPGTTVHHRDDLDAVQRDLREVAGVTVLIYDQTCAAEKRRRRKRGQMVDPDVRVVINEAVCEGCGDCGVQSNCVSIVPVETEFGRKRAIDQSTCNKDVSCVKGFCPSFVTVSGVTPKKRTAKAGPAGPDDGFPALPEPETEITQAAPYDILITGIGGTGVVTIGAILGMAAHLEGKGVSVLDQTGLAQKNGAVVSHVRLARRDQDIHAVRIAAGNTNLLLGCDMVTAAGADVLEKMRRRLTVAVLNAHQVMTADFTQHPDTIYPDQRLRDTIVDAAKETLYVDATRVATALLGDSITANLFMVGYAWQKGLIPIGRAAIERAVTLNGAAVRANLDAFLWGRRMAEQPERVLALVGPTAETTGDRRLSDTLDERIERRAASLRAYQNGGHAKRYRKAVARIRAAESRVVGPDETRLTDAVARALFKLMSPKDEYEVARLYTDGRFQAMLAERFEGGTPRARVHLAPPLFAKRDPRTGHLIKREYGPWVFGAFRVLARLKALRGTPLDPFGRTAERVMQRRLLADYRTLLDRLAEGLTADNHATAVALAALPLEMRGFGHVLEANVAAAQAKEADLLASFDTPAPRLAAE